MPNLALLFLVRSQRLWHYLFHATIRGESARSEEMGRNAQRLYRAGEALTDYLDRNFGWCPMTANGTLPNFARNTKPLQAGCQRFMQAGELQAGQVIGFVLEQGIGRQQTLSNNAANVPGVGG